MRSNNSARGFTLIELMIVVAIIAIIVAIVIPGLLRARIAANETSCIGTLRTLTSVQEQFKNAAIVDVDGDGAGEYGYLQELSGATPFRAGACGLSAAPTAPPFITTLLGLSASTSAIGAGTKSGYIIRIFLPDVDGGNPDAIPEANPLPCDVTRATAQSQRWAVYGWPTALRSSGNSCFFVDTRADIHFAQNVNGANYNGETTIVDNGNAALAPGEVNLDGTPPGVGVSQDLQNWAPVH